ncbi:MAG: hypothetical protein ACMXYG_00525 [Candidatus Woesearchaeota archaeon]
MSGIVIFGFEINLLFFFHFVGIIIGLGAVTVIDSMGFIARKSKKWTQTTIEAHHVTKPLIWIGTIVVLITWILMLFFIENLIFTIVKSILLAILIINGAFLSFYVSPRLDRLSGKNVLLPLELQIKITISMLISFTCWWVFVFLTFGVV